MAKMANVANMRENNGLEVEPLAQKELDENLVDVSYGMDMKMARDGKLITLDSRELTENKTSKKDTYRGESR